MAESESERERGRALDGAARPDGAGGAADPALVDPLSKKIPWPLRLFGVLGILGGAITVASLVLIALGSILLALDGYFAQGGFRIATLVLLAAEIALQLALGVLYFVLGVSLLRDRRRHTVGVARTTMILLVLSLLVNLTISGLSPNLIPTGVLIVIMIALQSYLDPSLAEERKLNRRLRRLDERAAEEARLEHLRQYRGKAPYRLNFFNIFWTFVACSVIGLVVELVFHLVTVGGYQDRAGLLFGPFSPIYGFGAVLMTLALNGIRDRNPVLIFLLSAAIGGAFEYFVSWFMQYAFGITAWDYTGTFLSIDGRTNGFFMACWGLLGVAWVKLLMPAVFKLIYLIPWDWRYGVTAVATALMVVDGAMTLQSLNCWYERASGQPVETGLQRFYADHFGDEYMEARFQTMTMDAADSTRVSRDDVASVAAGTMGASGEDRERVAA